MAIELPSECIAQTATAVAGRHKTIAGVMGAFVGLFAIASVAIFAEGREPASTGAGGLFWVALFAYFLMRNLRKAERARRAGAASLDRALRWFLEGRTVLATDAKGVPQPELAFDITAKLRTVLTAVPRAEVVQRSE